MMTADHAAIRARLDAANDDVGIAYSIPADEWVLTCDKPTMQALRHAPADLRALLDENETLAAIIEAVREIHAETEPMCPVDHHDPRLCPCAFIDCESCGEDYPCPTIRALDGSGTC